MHLAESSSPFYTILPPQQTSSGCITGEPILATADSFPFPEASSDTTTSDRTCDRSLISKGKVGHGQKPSFLTGVDSN